MNRFRILFFILFLYLPGIVFSQTIDWNESLLPKRSQVIIPDTLNFNLPTSDAYTIGFFTYDTVNNKYSNAGKADYIPGQKTVVSISLGDGISGYKNNDRFITLIKNKDNSDVYGVEFSYLNGKNKFTTDDSSIVIGLFTSTWIDYITGFSHCKFEKSLVLAIPYGIKTQILYTSNIKVDSSGVYPIIRLDLMEPSGCTIQIMEDKIKFTRTLLSFNLFDFPNSALNAVYSICPGDYYKVPDYNKDSTLKWYPLGIHTYKLNTPGKYPYTLMYYPNGCNTIDTITVQIDPKFQSNEFFKTYSICSGDTVFIPELLNDVVRSTSQYGTRNLYTEGIYFFPARDKISQCILMDTITVNFKPYPSNELNKSYSICPKNFIEILKVDSKTHLERVPLNLATNKIIEPGEYYFNAKFLTTGCVMKDTINVVAQTNCSETFFPNVIDPINGNGMVFSSQETITIYNAALIKMNQLKAPAIWNGTDQSGSILPVGVYYIMHEDGSSHSVSLIY